MAWIQLCFARTTVERSSESPSHAVPIYGVRSNAESGVAGLVRAGGERACERPGDAQAVGLGACGCDGGGPTVRGALAARSGTDVAAPAENGRQQLRESVCQYG